MNLIVPLKVPAVDGANRTASVRVLLWARVKGLVVGVALNGEPSPLRSALTCSTPRRVFLITRFTLFVLP